MGAYKKYTYAPHDFDAVDYDVLMYTMGGIIGKIRAAIERESVDLESMKSHETDYNRYPVNKGWNDCLEYLLKNHKGKVIG